MLIVYYNTLCPVCDTGISRYKAKLRQAVMDSLIAFEDINHQPDALAQEGIGIEAIRRKLHARDTETGRVLVGAEVIAAIWRLLPGYRLSGWLISVPPGSWLAQGNYHLLAVWLYGWNRRKGHW